MTSFRSVDPLLILLLPRCMLPCQLCSRETFTASRDMRHAFNESQAACPKPASEELNVLGKLPGQRCCKCSDFKDCLLPSATFQIDLLRSTEHWWVALSSVVRFQKKK